MSFDFPKQNKASAHDHYSLGKQLGSGAFSKVMLATNKSSGTEHAIKIVDKEETNAKDMYKELYVMSQLQHPNIVNYAEIFDEPDGFYVVMELITGGELFDRIVELSRYSEKDASRVLKDALLGLKHMHDAGFAHRDIKPENLLLSSRSNDANVKVADFGFSTKTDDDHDLWETLGTPPYMAPEIVILRNEDYTDTGYGRPVDVWALGICLYILLSGVHPYQREDDEEMLQMIENGTWPGWKREATWARVSNEAKDLVRSMMEPKAAKRLTIVQCLEHPWFLQSANEEDLGDIKDALKTYQAKKKMKGAILGIMATNKMKAGFNGLLGNMNNLSLNNTPQQQTVSKPVSVEPVKKFEGEMVIKAIAGRNLVAKDFNGKSDPYLNIWCGAYKFKTKTVKKNLSPAWNETFKVNYSKVQKKVIEIECMDYDFIGSDDFMGTVKLQVDSFKPGETINQWYPLQPNKSKKGKVSGEINIEIGWISNQ